MPIIHGLWFFLSVLNLFVFTTSSMAWADSSVSLVRKLGCFDTYNAMEKYLLLPIQEHSTTFLVGSGVIITGMLMMAVVAMRKRP